MKRLTSNTFTRGSLVVGVATCIGLAGCAADGTMNPTGRDTAIGAGLGALAGAAIGGNSKGALIGAGVGAAGGYVWSQHMQEKKLAMERATVGTGVAVAQTTDNRLKVDVPADAGFETGRADINPRLRPILDQFASGLANQPGTDVRILGHTDSTGPDELNDRLSLARAQSVRNYIVSRGVRPELIQIAGRGEHEPVADNSTEAGRARNRRVEVFLGDRANVAAR